MIIAIIPARGGSKRIPHKNVRLFSGKPIIQYSIDAALTAGVFDKVVVSTDCDQIAEVAVRSGAEVPFRRSASLSDDFSGIEKVVPDAIQAMESIECSAASVCCILATAPFVRATDLKCGFDMLRTGKWDYVVSATDFAFPVFRGFQKLEDDSLRMLYPEHYHTRSQDLPKVWHDAGQFYWGTRNAWMEERDLFSHRSTIVPIPRLRAIDIDTPDDWEFAEALYQVGAVKDGDARL